MYGVAREVVIDLIVTHGGEAFFTEVDERGGPEWQGYRYYVAKIE
jgi:hypothetical protein